MDATKPWVVGCATVLAALAWSGAHAQSRQRSGSSIQDRTRQSQTLQSRDRDRLTDRARLQERDLARDRLRDRELDRDRLLTQQGDRIYGASLMSAQERNAYQERLHSLATEQERVQFRLQHQQQMQQRARAQGAQLPASPTRAQIAEQERARQQERAQIYGYALMSEPEVNRYLQRLHEASNEQQREQIRAAHRTEMQQRARAQGVKLD